MRFPAEIRSAFLAHFGVPAVCEAAHLDRSRQNNEISTAIILCSNCYKMLDWDQIFGDTLIAIRDRPKIVTWSKRMKDAGKKTAQKRKRTLVERKRPRRDAGMKQSGDEKSDGF